MLESQKYTYSLKKPGVYLAISASCIYFPLLLLYAVHFVINLYLGVSQIAFASVGLFFVNGTEGVK